MTRSSGSANLSYTTQLGDIPLGNKDCHAVASPPVTISGAAITCHFEDIVSARRSVSAAPHSAKPRSPRFNLSRAAGHCGTPSLMA